MKKQMVTKLSALLLFYAINHEASAQVQWVLDTVIQTGIATTGIAVTPDDSKIVVTNNTSPGAVKVISTANYSISNIDISSVGNYPTGVTITPDGALALVTTPNKVAFINLSSYALSGNFAAPCVATTLYKIAVTANGANAVFADLNANCINGGLRSIDATGQTPGSTIIPVSTSGSLYGIAITGNSAVVTAWNAAPLNVNLSTSAIQTIAGLTASYGLALLHNGNEALIFDGDSIVRVSLTSNTVTKTISYLSFNSSFDNIAVTADDKYAFVTGYYEKLVISLDADSVIQTFAAGGVNVASVSDGSRFFVTDAYNGTVRVYKQTAAAGINDLVKNDYPVSIHPNPTADKIKVKNKQKISAIEIYNMVGEKVYQSPVTSATNIEESIDLSAQPNGIYFVKIYDMGRMHTQKIMVQH